jgi:hypothetical protein
MRLHNTIGYSISPYRPVQDHMRDYYTSRTAGTKSCSHLTPPSYIRHHSNTPVPHPLALDVIWACLCQTHRLNQCRCHQRKLQHEKDNKCTRKTFKITITTNCKILTNERRKITWRRLWWWPCLKGRTPKMNLSSTSVHLFLFGKVMFPSAGCLTPPLLFDLLC